MLLPQVVKMSRASRITLGVSVIGTVGTIYYVFYQQAKERDDLKKGILREEVRKEKKKAENLARLKEQEAITSMYKNLEPERIISSSDSDKT